MYVTITRMYTMKSLTYVRDIATPTKHMYTEVYVGASLKHGSMMLNVDVQCTVPKQPFTRPPLKDSPAPACTLIANRHQQCSWALSPPNPAPVHDH